MSLKEDKEMMNKEAFTKEMKHGIPYAKYQVKDLRPLEIRR